MSNFDEFHLFLVRFDVFAFSIRVREENVLRDDRLPGVFQIPLQEVHRYVILVLVEVVGEHVLVARRNVRLTK